MPDPTDDDHHLAGGTDLRSFGRRRGRKISSRQQQLLAELLPRVRVDLASPPPAPLSSLFSSDCHPGRREIAARAEAKNRIPGTAGVVVTNGSRLAGSDHEGNPSTGDVWLEIGFGGAEHLLWQAREHPHVGVIGCEPFEEGVVKALSGIEQHALSNVRIHSDDARDVLRWLPDASIARTFILFPDPWPKRKHIKRRLINPRLLTELARVMAPGAELRIATDIGDYARTILIALQAEPRFTWLAETADDWRKRPADWPRTRYEEKALREGRRCAFLRLRRCQH